MKKLAGYDVVAPISDKPMWNFNWEQARKLTIDAFKNFDNEMGDVVEKMFTKRQIDAVNRVGKTNGAFCAVWPGAKSSFIMLTYNETLNDVYTLAHENGHAVHGHLSSHNQTLLNWGASACVAETGSIFGELLLTENLLTMAETKEQKIELLASILNDYFYTVYYVGMRALFEKSIYEKIKEGKLIDAETACDLWNTAKERVFGNSVDWSEHMEYEWARIPHHFIPNYRFYNYSYCFAQMLVYALYAVYKERGSEFVEQFRQLLTYGGSKNPKDQIATMGFDITDPSFWELGAKQASQLLSELKKLI